MDHYDFSEVTQPRKRKPAGSFWNALTILISIITLCIAIAFILIYFNPSISLNPFQSKPSNLTSALRTATVTPRIVPVPSWTVTYESVKPTEISRSSQASLVTDTPMATPIEEQPTVLAEALDAAFIVRAGSPAAIDAVQFHPDSGCKWQGVAGQATSLNGEAVKGLFIHLWGSLPGVSQIDNLTMTGLAPQYGPGGFEITISDHPVASSGKLWIQLLDQDNLPLSNRIYFDTFDDCSKNLVIIYFDQVR